MANYFYRELIPEINPTTIRVTPILPADQMPDEHAVFETVAQILFTQSLSIARNLSQGQMVTRAQLLSNATGWLQMTNTDNNAHAHVENIRLSDLDVFALYDLFDRVHAESNPDLSVYTVQWEFWVNPQSVVLGGARLGLQRDGTCDISNKIYEYDGTRAGCAAVCAAVFLIKQLPEHRALNNQIKRPTAHRKIYNLALKLQDDLGTFISKHRLVN